MKTRSREWVAERSLREGAGRGRLVVRLAKAYEVAETEWVCHIEIRRGRRRIEVDVRGYDSFQAMILALRVIRKELDKLGSSIEWEGGESGDTGFPLYVTDLFGLELTRRLEAIVESETERFLAERKPRAPADR